MLRAALRSGRARHRAVFVAFARHLPAGRRYGVVAGTGRLLEALERFRFDAATLQHLPLSRGTPALPTVHLPGPAAPADTSGARLERRTQP